MVVTVDDVDADVGGVLLIWGGRAAGVADGEGLVVGVGEPGTDG